MDSSQAVRKDEVPSSNLGSSSRESLGITVIPRDFSMWGKSFPLLAGNSFDEGLHPGGAGLLHLVGHMAVDIQGESGGGVAQVALHRFNVVPGTDRSHGVGVPLWHNKDKSENPCGATG